MKEPTVFKPHALSRAPIVRECRYEYVPTTTERDWSGFDAPACDRIDSRSVCATKFREERMEALSCAMRMTG